MPEDDHKETLFEEELLKEEGPVECLGTTFENDESRRDYFLGILRKKLNDPEFRKIEGFPIGEDEDILALSDPPYYTACPNPFIEDFVKFYGKPYYSENDNYHKEPFAADVSEGKNDPIYNAHSYHTKVPHKAIMRYILHYTDPGDIVFDGFCGTGMTGVAAQLCGDKATVESLDYTVDKDGTIFQQETDKKGKSTWQPVSKLGARYAILNDLSPAATFIAYNCNTPVDVEAFEREAKRILKEVEDECGWMYRTLHAASSRTEQRGLTAEWAEKLSDCKTIDEIRSLLDPQSSALGTVIYTVWSDVFVCPECTREVIFWEAAVDKEAGKVHNEFPCPHCNALLTKRNMDRAWATKVEPYITKASVVRQAKQVPVLINYRVGKKRYKKTPDEFDLALIEKIEQLENPYWFPNDRMPEGYNTQQPKVSHGLTHVHHFYTKRNLWVLGAYCFRAKNRDLFLPSSLAIHINKMRRYQPVKQGGTPGLPGTLYVSAISVELPFFDGAPRKYRDVKKAFEELRIQSNTVSTGDASFDPADSNTIDYIFTDPPFGGNLMYSELNFLWEAWLKVFTNNKPEAIENKTQGKGLPEYQRLMTKCFKEYYRLLKPGRWMTVEFHNSKNAVWNAIQEALQHAGFVIADVRTLDKQQGTFKQVTSTGAVRQDLVISAYKPNQGLEERFKLEAGTEEGAWDFVRTHLRQLPVFVEKEDSAEVIAERQNYLLFDRMVAFHVQRGVTVPLSAGEFYAGLPPRFPERDGMYFLPEQAAEYDKKRAKVAEVVQLELFVTDESSAIQWLKQQLEKKPQTFQELQPLFLKEIAGWEKYEKPLELSELLNGTFLLYDGKGDVPSQIHSYLSSNYKEMRNLSKDDPALKTKAKGRYYVPDPDKAQDLEKLREKALLREFGEYRASKVKKLKVFRIEAVRAGFKKAWQENDYDTIVEVAGKIPDKVLQEDPKLLMWYDVAVSRMGGE